MRWALREGATRNALGVGSSRHRDSLFPPPLPRSSTSLGVAAQMPVAVPCCRARRARCASATGGTFKIAGVAQRLFLPGRAQGPFRFPHSRSRNLSIQFLRVR